jgi:glycosyltransferase involved in cell wall biosynthesis
MTLHAMSQPRPGALIAPRHTGASRRVILWHWGKAGAGAKYTFELARAMRDLPGACVSVCAAADSELANLAATLPEIALHRAATFSGDKSALSGKLAAGYALLHLPALGNAFRRLVADLDETDVIVCTMQSIWDAAALSVLRRCHARFVLVLHDAQFHPGDSYPFRDFVLRREVSCADALITLTDHVGAAAQRIHRFPAQRIWKVPHGAFEFGSAVAKPRSFPAGRPIRLLFFGRIAAYKGLGLLLAAYRDLPPRVQYELEIIGSGDLSPYRSALAGLGGVAVRNEWVDDEDIAAALARADVVLLPYIEASQSGVAAGALAAGIPVIATPVGGLVEQVLDGVTGVVAAGLQPRDLTAAIVRLSTSPDLYEACSRNGLALAQTHLSWKGIAQQIYAVIGAVTAQPKRGATT